MNLYLFYDSSVEENLRGKHCSDVYDAFVISADSMNDIPKIALAYEGYNENCEIDIDKYYKNWKLKLIGVALPELQTGVICASWSSSG